MKQFNKIILSSIIALSPILFVQSDPLSPLPLHSSGDILDNHLVFCDHVEPAAIIEKEIYQQMVEKLPILTVDVLIYNEKTKQYLMVYRKNAPAKDIYWIIGGRMFKGESFFDCAIRKSKEEVGVAIKPLEILGVYSTIFGDSAWGCQTHTVNTAVLATIFEHENPLLDEHHGDFKWVDINIAPGNDYLDDIWRKARTLLAYY